MDKLRTTVNLTVLQVTDLFYGKGINTITKRDQFIFLVMS